jgi:hypothetical protein
MGFANVTVSQPQRAADFIVRGAEFTAPPQGTVLAESAGLAGSYTQNTILLIVNVSSDDSKLALEVAQQRGGADHSVAYISANATPGMWQVQFQAQAGDVFLVRAKNAGTASMVYQVDMLGYRL